MRPGIQEVWSDKCRRGNKKMSKNKAMGSEKKVALLIYIIHYSSYFSCELGMKKIILFKAVFHSIEPMKIHRLNVNNVTFMRL